MENDHSELMKLAIKHYIELKLGEDCTCLPDHDACEFCRNKNAYDELQSVSLLGKGEYPK
jgi:hypothetical protein